MSGYKTQFKPIPKNLLDFGKLKLFADKLEDGERRPTFGFKCIRGIFYATVMTNVPTDIKNGYMSLKLDPRNLYAFLTLFNDVINGKLTSARINVEERIWDNEEKKLSEEPVLLGSLKVAKDKKGLYYISLVIEKRPKIQFYFSKNFNANLIKDDGSELTEAEYSHCYALAYYRMMMDFIPPVIANNADQIFDSPFKEENGNETFNSNNTDNGGLPEIDDDMPM